MKVIVKNNDGTYYASKVFGIINNNIADEYNQGWKYKYVVFDKNQEKLVILNEYEKLSHEILTYDVDKSDMELDKNYIGKVNFLSNEEYEKILNNKVTPEIIEKCKKYIIEYKDEYMEIKTQKDIDNLMEVFWGFHDSYIKEIHGNDEELIVLFNSCWGCNLEMIFSGNVMYKNLRTSYEGDLDWFDATIIIDKYGIKLVDYEGYEPNDSLEKVSTWFTANSAKYKIIPTFKEKKNGSK